MPSQIRPSRSSTIARMVDACAMHGIYPYYGPFGDIADVVACEDQFRNAFLLGCVGTWSLHPVQIEIAKRVFSPSAEDVAHARRVVAAMGDGTGAVMLDGKMEDDASLKQCLVLVELAEQLTATDPAVKKQCDAIEVRPWTPPPPAALGRKRQVRGADSCPLVPNGQPAKPHGGPARCPLPAPGGRALTARRPPAPPGGSQGQPLAPAGPPPPGSPPPPTQSLRP